MADRSVKVRLEAEIAQYKRELAEAAALTAGFAKSVGGTRGPLNNLEKDSNRAGREIDRLSGRLRLFADIGAVLGPVLAPLGAAAVGGFIALSAQLGAAAGALGVTVLAVNGLGDGLKALNAYQLEPTAENLEKLNQEMTKLGPSGAAFVEFLESIGPELKSLQFAARDGLLPGAEEGIENLLTMLPQVRSIINNFATTLGDLSEDAGAALAGPEFEDFFNYLETDAVRILDDTARTAGNLVEALGHLFVAFAPLQGDFANALLKWSEGLADAASNMSSSDGLTEFLIYIEDTGPQVVETLSALANAMLQIVQAAAPLGGPVLQVLETMASVISAIADSDLGTPIMTGLAALSLYTRATKLLGATGTSSLGQIVRGQKQVDLGYARGSAFATTLGRDLNNVARYGTLATESSKRLGSQLATAGRAAGPIAGLALATSGAADSIGLTNTASMALVGTFAGPWGAAVGGAIGLGMDLAASNNGVTESLEQLHFALRNANPESADFGSLTVQMDEAQRKVIELAETLNDPTYTDFSDLKAGFKNTAEGIFGRSDYEEAFSELESAKKKLAELAAAAGSLDGGQYMAAAKGMAEADRNLAAAAEEAVNAMRAKRQEALRGVSAALNYQQAIDDARKSLKENGKTVDETTEKGRANLRTLYALAGGWNEQSDAAKNAKGSLSAAKDNFIETANAMGMPIRQAERLAARLFEIPENRRVKIFMETDSAMSRLVALKNRYDAIRDKSVTISINSGGGTGGGSPMGVALAGEADGGTIPGRRTPYGDKGLYMLAPGEEVISNRWGQADRHRGLLKKINAGLADGGSAAHGQYLSMPGGPNMGINGLSAALNGIGELKDALKKFQKQLEEATKAVDREKRQRDELIAASEAFAAAVGGAYATADPFAGGLSDFDTATAANTNDSNAANAALAAAASQGLDGPLYQALAASGNLALLLEFAGLSAAQIEIKEQQFATQSSAQANLAAGAVDAAGFTAAIKEQTKELKEAQKERRQASQLVKEVQRRLDQLPDRVERGARQGVRDRDGQTAARVRTGG